MSLRGILLFSLGMAAAFAQRGGGTAGQLREVTVTDIPGVIAAGSVWKLVWQGTDNADGIVGTKDGGLLFAQEQPSRVSKLDGKDAHVTPFLEDTHGTGALSVDAKGRIFGVERTCTDPGRDPANCKEPTAVAVLAPERRILADNIDGKSLGRLNDLIVDKKGGIYFNGAALFYLNPAGKVAQIGENIRTNGITLSRDEKTLYVTNGGEIVTFDIQPDDSCATSASSGTLGGYHWRRRRRHDHRRCRPHLRHYRTRRAGAESGGHISLRDSHSSRRHQRRILGTRQENSLCSRRRTRAGRQRNLHLSRRSQQREIHRLIRMITPGFKGRQK